MKYFRKILFLESLILRSFLQFNKNFQFKQNFMNSSNSSWIVQIKFIFTSLHVSIFLFFHKNPKNSSLYQLTLTNYFYFFNLRKKIKEREILRKKNFSDSFMNSSNSLCLVQINYILVSIHVYFILFKLSILIHFFSISTKKKIKELEILRKK